MAYGDGSFTRQKNKQKDKWKYRKFYRSKADGITRRLTVSGETQKECREKMRAREIELDASLRKQNVYGGVTKKYLFDGLHTWLKRKKYGKIKSTAYDRIESIIENQIEPFEIGAMYTDDVTSNDINEHLHYLQYEHVFNGKNIRTGYSYSTVKKTYELLDQFFKDYYADDINNNPMNKVDHPQPTKNVGELDVAKLKHEIALPDIVLSDEEINKFKEQVYLPPSSGVEGRSKYGIAFYFMMMTCLRFGEAVALTWQDIDFDNRQMLINKTASRVKNRGKGDNKTKRIITTPKNAKTRVVMLSKEALEALETIRERSKYTKPTDLVLCTKNGSMVLHNEFWLRLKGTLRGAGLMNDAREEKFTPHYLRHTGISYYIRNGVPLEMVSKMAGHSSIAITEQVYYHVIYDQQQKMLEMMDEIREGDNNSVLTEKKKSLIQMFYENGKR